MITPMPGYVAVVEDITDKTSGGIVLPDSANKKEQRGTVVAVGAGEFNNNGTRNEPSVKVGDKVVFVKYAGCTVKLDDQETRFMKEREILAVLETTN